MWGWRQATLLFCDTYLLYHFYLNENAFLHYLKNSTKKIQHVAGGEECIFEETSNYQLVGGSH